MKEESAPLTFAERVRAEVGETTNPAYLESVLGQDDIGVYKWLHDQCPSMQRIIEESAVHHDRRAQRIEPRGGSGVHACGFGIMEGHLKMMLFVLGELRKRVVIVESAISPAGEPSGEQNGDPGDQAVS